MFPHGRGERKEEKVESGEGVRKKGKVETLRTDVPRLLTSLPTTEARGKNEDDSKHTPACSY